MLHAGSATVEGLATILGKLDHRVASRNTLLAANSILFDKVSRTFELDLEKGGTFTWEVAHPLLLLQEMVGGSAELQDLIRRMLLVDPLKRMSLVEVRQHPW